jgi:hypothetical protein
MDQPKNPPSDDPLPKWDTLQAQAVPETSPSVIEVAVSEPSSALSHMTLSQSLSLHTRSQDSAGSYPEPAIPAEPGRRRSASMLLNTAPGTPHVPPEAKSDDEEAIKRRVFIGNIAPEVVPFDDDCLLTHAVNRAIPAKAC